jgi:hypothetical protein
VIDQRSRLTIQRVCAHVLSRERHQRTGRIGLGWTGRGIGTDVMWLDAGGLHRESADTAGLAAGAHRLTTLAELASWAGVDLDAAFDAGAATPEIGDRDAPLAIADGALTELLHLYEWAWAVLTDVADGESITLWPEHFDAAFIWREQANVGFSPGDDHLPEPYLYVGPFGPERPGAPNFWNAPFGATTPAPTTRDEAIAFITEAQARLSHP